MFEHYLSKNLKEGEEVLRFVRCSPWSLIGRGLVVAVMLLAPFFFLFPLLRLGAWGAGAVVALLIIGIVLLVRFIILYAFNVLLVTTHRIIDVDQRGLLHREVSESGYEKIQDVSFSMRGIFQTLFRYGNILIQTAGAQANLEIKNVREPEKVQELIMKLQHEYAAHTKSENPISDDELVAVVRRLKASLGEERFRTLIRKL